ncbi:MAG: DUF3487 family protein [Deltaproteobacteria bacterium]|nr:DUF3487 family protein [Deltaproteobacteria bacterium]
MRMVALAKCLDKRLLLFGFEVMDIMAIFLMLAILNFIFSSSSKLLFVWLPTILIAAVLRLGKRGKPEKFLVHWIRFQFRDGIYSAFLEPSKNVSPPTLKRGNRL